MYEDPVKKAEMEIEELVALQQAELNPDDGSTEKKPDTENADGTSSEKTGSDGQADKEKREEKKASEDAAAGTKGGGSDEDPNGDTFKQRWLTSQGMHRADMRRLSDQVAVLTQQNQSLIQQLQEAQARSVQQPSDQGKGLEETLADLEAEYGSAFSAAIDKRIDDRVNQRLAPVEQKVNQVHASQAQTVQDGYASALTQACPDWAALNTDPAFIQYLNDTVDDLSGMTYQEMLNEAHRQRNATRVAKFFNMYLQSQGQQATQTNTKQPTKTTRTDSPDELIAPTKRGSGDQVKIEDNKGKVFTMAEVNEIYKNIELGKYTIEVAKQKEQEIWEANQEGRIVG